MYATALTAPRSAAGEQTGVKTMRALHIALPVIALLLSGGATLAATGTTDTTAPGATTTQPTTTTHHRRHSPTSPATSGSTETGAAAATTPTTATPATTAAKTTAVTTSGVGKFASESQAAQACGASNVVWANTSTKVFHVQGDQYFGHTKHGAFMCKTTATAGGFHLSGQKG